jgi:uncharacterized protein YecT (DUF1311 family)
MTEPETPSEPPVGKYRTLTPPRCLIAALLCGAAFLLSPVVRAQSFDCKRASTVIEQAICDDAAVGNLDQRLSRAVEHLLVRHPDWRNQLSRTERHWIRFRDAACSQFAHNPAAMEPCLTTQYTERLAALESTQPLQDSTALPDPEKCDVVPNVAAIACLGGLADALEPILSEYYKVARNSTRRKAATAPEYAADDFNEALADLTHAQAAWKAYRDAHCKTVADLYMQGSGRAAGQSTCVIKLTEYRIHELWEVGGFAELPEPNQLTSPACTAHRP